jgi:molybdopterin-guanine dinucleotide biosynthesis protein MobB
MRDISAVILAGGESSRMGEDKALLRLGNETFLERISAQLSAFGEVLLSVDNAARYPESTLKTVEDRFARIGPMGGIYSALQAGEVSRLLVVSCDMPLFPQGLADYMCSFVSDDYDAFVVVTREGRLQPLCAVYAKSAAPILKKQIEEKNYRLADALAQMRVKHIPLHHSIYGDEAVQNINTPTEYAMLRRQLHGPPVIAVSGLKNSGKTTLTVGIISCLRRLGLRVAAVKHDGHDFVPDVPGTDSFRFREAGAFAVAVYSENRYMLTAEYKDTLTERLSGFNMVRDMTGQFRDADIVLLEGGKRTDYPKIEVVRQEISSQPVCDPKTLLALCTDFDLRFPGVPVVSIDDYDAVTKVILTYLQKGD